MSSDIAIRLSDVSKSYLIYDRPSDRLKHLLFPKSGARYQKTFQALKGIDLEIGRGETVGIIGRNGAGKSTLLQILCGIAQPTGGKVEVHGRLAPLLALGAGFAPEFSGRENIRLSASIHGLGEAEIRDRMGAIIDFADIGDFVDRPVKTYSSGMYARLAFAIAINVDPEILVVDEALAVGDEAFQRKCFVRLEEIRSRGGTILFVSHNAGTILQLCNRAVLLDHGEILAVGAPNLVINHYHRLAFASADQRQDVRAAIRRGEASLAVADAADQGDGTVSIRAAEPSDMATFDPNLKSETIHYYDSRGATISDLRIVDARGQRVNLLTQGFQYTLSYAVSFATLAHMVRCSMLIKTVGGINLSGGSTHPMGDGIALVPAGSVLNVSFTFRADLHAEAYFINAGVLGAAVDGEVYLHRIVDAAMVKVLPNAGQVFTGYANLLEGATCELQGTSVSQED